MLVNMTKGEKMSNLKNPINEIKYQDNLLASNLLKVINYIDCFELKSQFDTIDGFTKDYFLAQPAWLRLISFGVLQKKTLIDILKETSFQKNDSIGQWKVYGRNENEIVFGQNMGFMEYCFSFKQEDKKTLRVTTLVEYKGKMGKYYFSIVSLLHKPFVKRSLKNVLERRSKLCHTTI